MPTTIPAAADTMLDNAVLLISSVGAATLVVILAISAWKYVRGVS